MAAVEKDSIALLFARFNLRGLSSHLERVEVAAQAGSWSYRQFLRELLEAEEQLRTQRRLKRLLKESQLPEGKTAANLELKRFSAQNRRAFTQLCEGAFCESAHNVLAFGLPGRGKTHFLAALGQELILRHQKRVTLAEALLRGRVLDEEGLFWIEEPIRHDDYIGCATLAGELATPIQIGENFAGPRAMAAAIGARAADYMMPDLERIGGVTGWHRAASLAAATGIELSSHLYPEASAHLLAVSPTCHWLEYVDWANPILNEPLQIVDGGAIAPDRPGIGLSWNEDAVARYRIS